MKLTVDQFKLLKAAAKAGCDTGSKIACLSSPMPVRITRFRRVENSPVQEPVLWRCTLYKDSSSLSFNQDGVVDVHDGQGLNACVKSICISHISEKSDSIVAEPPQQEQQQQQGAPMQPVLRPHELPPPPPPPSMRDTYRAPQAMMPSVLQPQQSTLQSTWSKEKEMEYNHLLLTSIGLGKTKKQAPPPETLAQSVRLVSTEITRVQGKTRRPSEDSSFYSTTTRLIDEKKCPNIVRNDHLQVIPDYEILSHMTKAQMEKERYQVIKNEHCTVIFEGCGIVVTNFSQISLTPRSFYLPKELGGYFHTVIIHNYYPKDGNAPLKSLEQELRSCYGSAFRSYDPVKGEIRLQYGSPKNQLP
ncbi:hypothetical protein GMRT_11457 [Giardia muris]|uniref:Uncharacterized protein n=1 Tax=Giardia muris TaxID=5742 RepID=A0A4Z1TB55_GIAMU|nr:hypothetical protein GMRT_11457 [Giardia muris]|eukprot:TNJ29761.1 hypothetical protein GMRT_11457 [Giardia muris]